MTRQVKVGDTVIDQFPVFDFDGYSKVSGQTSFDTEVWKDGVAQGTSVTISEIGSSGEYKISLIPDSPGWWKVEVDVNYNHDVMVFEYQAASGSMDEVYSSVRRLLGLSHENIFIDNTVYDPNLQLLDARVRIFDTGEHCDLATDGGSETDGLLGTYALSTIWQGINQFKTFKQTILT